MVGALVTADLDTLTTIHTHTLCIRPKNVPRRSSLVRLHESLPTHNSFYTLHGVLPIFVNVQKFGAINVKAPLRGSLRPAPSLAHARLLAVCPLPSPS
jgi:hypothetical protein